MIVDDGSHVPEHQQATLEGLWSALKPGGVYIIEVHSVLPSAGVGMEGWRWCDVLGCS